jgi:hypothetical protein
MSKQFRTVLDSLEPIVPEEPWQRHKEEPEEDFEFFRKYRDRGLKRSLTELSIDTGLHLSDIKELADKWHWFDRAVQFDNHTDDRDRQRDAAEARRMQVRQAQRAIKMQEYGEKLLNMCEKELDDHPELVQRNLTKLMIQARFYIDQGIRLERLARGESETRQNVDLEIEIARATSKFAKLLGVEVKDIIPPKDSKTIEAKPEVTDD